jgi:hypothetical protein
MSSFSKKINHIFSFASRKKSNLLFVGLVLVILFTALNAIYSSIFYAFSIGSGTFLFHGDLFADFFKFIFSYPYAENYIKESYINLPNLLKEYAINNPYQGVAAFDNWGKKFSHLHVTPLTTLISLLLIDSFDFFGYLLTSIAVITLVFASIFFSIKNFCTTRFEFYFLFLLFVLSYPFLFLVQRGNVFSFIATISLVFSYIFIKKNKISTAAFLVALAINIRPNLIIFSPFIFWISNRHIKFIIFLFLYLGSQFFLSLLICSGLYPDYTLTNFAKALTLYKELYVIGNWGVGFNTSIFGLLKVVALALNSIIKIDIRGVLEVLILLTGLMTIGLFFQLNYMYHKKKFNEIEFCYLLTATLMLGTTVIADYHLLIFIIPIMVIVNNYSVNLLLKKSSVLIFLTSCFVLSPFNYFLYAGIYFSEFLKTILVVASCVYIITSSKGLKAKAD